MTWCGFCKTAPCARVLDTHPHPYLGGCQVQSFNDCDAVLLACIVHSTHIVPTLPACLPVQQAMAYRTLRLLVE